MSESLSLRYQHICQANDRFPNGGVVECLRKCGRSEMIILQECSPPLVDDDVIPIALLIRENQERSFRLRFGSNKLTCKGATILASLLQVHHKILAISLHGNLIKDEGIAAFGASLANCSHTPNLLDFSDNQITDHGVSLFCKGLAFRTSAKSITVCIQGNSTSEIAVSSICELMLTNPGLLARVGIEPITQELRAVADETGTTLLNGGFEERINRLEGICSFPGTQESKIKKLSARVTELEKIVSDAQSREQYLINKIQAIEETVGKEQAHCLRILKQCTKMIGNEH